MKAKDNRAALFDFDGTLIRGDSIVLFIRFALKNGALKIRGLPLIAAYTLGARIGLCPMEKAKEKALRFETTLPPPEKEKLCRDFVSQILVPRIYPGGKRAWDALRADGRRMVLASASTSDYMVYLSAALGADALLCTRVAEDASVGPNCRGKEKARRAACWAQQNGVDLKASDAFGDSAGDIYLLRLCGRPHAVNPKRKLKREAKEKGWETLRWGKEEE